jgi:hypothetical protein
MDVFTVSGDEILFSDAEELERTLGELDSSVPGRTEGRRSHHRERYCITRYLSTLSNSSLLNFPLRVLKAESPDFFLFGPDSTVTGLEITEAGTERHQRTATELERRPPGTLLEGEGSLRQPGESLQGLPYVGDEPERELASLVLRAVMAKTNTLNRSHFAEADLHELLIYDNSHLAVVAELEDLAPLLKNSLLEWRSQQQSERQFVRISVLRDAELLYDCTGQGNVLQVPRIGTVKREIA